MALSRLCCNANKFLLSTLQNSNFQALRVPKHARNFQRFSEVGRSSPRRKLLPQNGLAGLGKPFIFTIAFCSSSIVTAAIWEYENNKDVIRQHLIPFYRRPRLQEMGIRQKIRHHWQELAEWQRVYIPICLLNFLVFCAWRVPSLQPFMKSYFMITPGSRNIYWQMILPTFSHIHGLHILTNMIALCSSMKYAMDSFGPELFWAFYLSSGVVSNMFSLTFKKMANITVPSLGASGAVFGVISFLCVANSNLRVHLFFLPFLSFNALSIIKVNLAVDITGCIMRWQVLDHAAHIGGTVFGMSWYYYIQEQISPIRTKVISYWKKIRTDND